MVKTFIALRHMSDKEFGVEFLHEKVSSDLGLGLLVCSNSFAGKINVWRKKGELMNVFIILSILIIVIGVILLVVTPSVLFKLNWNEKTGKEKILMFMFYSILVYIINIIYWIIKWVGTRYIGLSLRKQLTQY